MIIPHHKDLNEAIRLNITPSFVCTGGDSDYKFKYNCIRNKYQCTVDCARLDLAETTGSSAVQQGLSRYDRKCTLSFHVLTRRSSGKNGKSLVIVRKNKLWENALEKYGADIPMTFG